MGAAAPSAVAERASAAFHDKAWPEDVVVLHARDDTTVPVQSARGFAEALRPVAPHLRYDEYERAGHGEVMIALMSKATMEELPEMGRDFVRAVGMRDV